MAQEPKMANPNPGEWLRTSVPNPITGLPEEVRASYWPGTGGYLLVSRWYGATMFPALLCRTREEAIGAVRGWVER